MWAGPGSHGRGSMTAKVRQCPGISRASTTFYPTSAKDATYGVMWAMRGQPHDAVAGRWESIVGSVLLSPVKMTDGRDSPQIKPMHSRPIGRRHYRKSFGPA